MSLQRVKNSNDCIAVICQAFMRQLYLHFGLVFLQAQLSMFLEQPRRDVALADSTQNRERWRMIRRVFDAGFGKLRKILSENFGAHSEGLHKEFGKVNGDLANNVGPDHPHGLNVASSIRKQPNMLVRQLTWLPPPDVLSYTIMP